MRSFTYSVLVASSIAAVTCHSPAGLPRRKTLSFGPVHPHAKFSTAPEPYLAQGSSIRSSTEPYEVARTFVTNLLAGRGEGQSFVIRDDSYTDDRTGVTHVYVKQLFQGFKVDDGDMNINIKDGVVISYGDSFYHGAPVQNPDLDQSPHHDYCAHLMDHVSARRAAKSFNFGSADQQPLSAEPDHAQHVPTEEELELLAHLEQSNCAFFDRQSSQAAPSNVPVDPREAALTFMIAATPNTELAQSIPIKYEQYLAGIDVSTTNHFTGGEHPIMHLTGVPDTVNPVKVEMVYTQVPQGDSTVLKLAWKMEVEMQDNWYEALIDALKPGQILSVVDWASDSSARPIPKDPESEGAVYNVFPWGINDPSEGKRSMEKENFDSLASPLGWHTIPLYADPSSGNRLRRVKGGSELINSTTTWGNNVFAHENWEGLNNWEENYRPDAGSSLMFNFSYDPEHKEGRNMKMEARKYINTTITQLFYTSNLVHDLYYRYGFDEKSGNFQQYNFGRGGAEGDAVIANAQDGSGFNNANFMTPPDGQNGRCRMYLWNTATPYRDGDLEAGIVIHELSHGLSTRLTGGPKDSSCLGWGESGGMGEGWGDFLATTIRSTANYSDYPMGAWAANEEKGIRNYIYSLNNTVNPSTYKTLDNPAYWGVHAIGEVWAEMLWIVSQRLIAKHGYSTTLFPPKPSENGTVPDNDFYRPAYNDTSGKERTYVPKHGNTLIVQLVLDGMKLQPCRPSFFDARDGIIQADEVLTGGENFCDLWKGFSERGLGPDARVEGRTPWGGGIRTNDYAVPRRCSTRS